MSRKNASNIVLLIKGGTEIVGRFEPGSESEDKKAVTPAMTKARTFIELALQDSNHPLHEALQNKQIELVNAKPEVIAPTVKVTFR